MDEDADWIVNDDIDRFMTDWTTSSVDGETGVHLPSNPDDREPTVRRPSRGQGRGLRSAGAPSTNIEPESAVSVAGTFGKTDTEAHTCGTDKIVRLVMSMVGRMVGRPMKTNA